MSDQPFVPPTRELALLAQNPGCTRLRVAVAAADGLTSLQGFAKRRNAERPAGESTLATEYGSRFERYLLGGPNKAGALLTLMQEQQLLPPNAKVARLGCERRVDLSSRLEATRRYIADAAQGNVRAHLLLHPVLEFDHDGARWPIVPDALVFSGKAGGFRPIEIKSYPYLGGRSGIENLRIALLQVAAASLALEEQEKLLGIKRPKRGSFSRATMVFADPRQPWKPYPLWDVAIGAERDHLRAAVTPALNAGLAEIKRCGASIDLVEQTPARFKRECYSCPAYRACRGEVQENHGLTILGDRAAERLALLGTTQRVGALAQSLSKGEPPKTEEGRRLWRALRIVKSIHAGASPIQYEESEEGSVADEVEALLRLEASTKDRAVLTRGVLETPLTPLPTIFSILLCPYENRLWGYALAKGEEPPRVVIETDPRGFEAELRLLTRLEEELVEFFSHPELAFPQMVVPSRAEVEALALLSHRTSPRTLPRLKEILAFLLDRAEEDNSPSLLIATSLLNRQLRSGHPPQDDSHLGVMLAWAEAYFTGEGAHADAIDAEQIPMGPRLSPEHEDAAAQVFTASDITRRKYEARTRAILHAHLTRSATLASRAIEIVRRLSLPTPPHHNKLIEQARDRGLQLMTRILRVANQGYYFSETSPYMAARSYLDRVAGKYDTEFWSREGDLRAALEAEDSGLAEPAIVGQLDRLRATILCSCRRRSSRLREGDRLAIRGFSGKVSGTLRQIISAPDGSRWLSIDITTGQRTAMALGIGQEIMLHPTSMSAIAIRKKMLLKESKQRLPWLFDPRAAMPTAVPRPNTPTGAGSTMEIPLQPSLGALNRSLAAARSGLGE
jgi:hypothetical protein